MSHCIYSRVAFAAGEPRVAGDEVAGEAEKAEQALRTEQKIEKLQNADQWEMSSLSPATSFDTNIDTTLTILNNQGRRSTTSARKNEIKSKLIKVLLEQHGASAAYLEVKDVPYINGDPKGKGVYARKLLPKDTFLVEYTGKCVTDSADLEKDWKEPQTDYCLFLSKKLMIDASKPNISIGGRFNDCSITQANCKMSHLRYIGDEQWDIPYLMTLRTIQKDEELVWNYGEILKSRRNWTY